ncbi:hypothetical protein QAD02_019246 [Eretmocerus hayati]|uniref:Uncharacterized protein n=1 Tax=Eretmocerus hayati TaxID=131215 RepID=A0ACC2PIN1_9HYME|nr:hypothetical protein QAD02_019246 [Eretmocerus hayati]
MSSGTGGHSNQATIVTPTTKVMTQPTFTTVSANSMRPKRQDAIVFDSVENLTNDDYLDGLEELIDLVHVKAISKISGGRVSVYLSSRNLVDEVKNKRLQMKEYTLVIKPLINNNKRVVISSVHLSIPDEGVTEALKNTTACPKSNDNRSSLTSETLNNLNVLSPSAENQESLRSDENSKGDKPIPPNVNKRPLSTSASETSTRAAADGIVGKSVVVSESRVAETVKNPRIGEPEDFELVMRKKLPAAADYFKDNPDAPLSYEEFSDFLIKSHGNRKPKDLALTYTNGVI